MSGSPAVLTYAACGLLIVVYASGRFNTPPSNRSSTRQTPLLVELRQLRAQIR